MNEGWVHSVLRSVRRSLKDIYWTVRGLGYRPRPISKSTRSILFVCKGNICRSPFGERRLRQLLRSHGIEDVSCSSAGFEAKIDGRPPDFAQRVALSMGTSLAEHRPTPLSTELVNESDVIVVMEAVHVDQMQQKYAWAMDRVVLLPQLGGGAPFGYGRYNIADPFGKDTAAFVECYNIMEHHLQALVEELTRVRA